jgi:hypothetical protein
VDSHNGYRPKQIGPLQVGNVVRRLVHDVAVKNQHVARFAKTSGYLFSRQQSFKRLFIRAAVMLFFQ